MQRYLLLFFAICSASLWAQKTSPLKFRKQMIASESFESVGVADINGDNVPDIMSGSFWYEGPDFLVSHYIGPVTRFNEFYNDFSTIPMEVNGDGRIDFITGGLNKPICWIENPGKDTEWIRHEFGDSFFVETTRIWDIDGDGFEEIVPNSPGNPLIYYAAEKNTTRRPPWKFIKTKIADTQGHGLGFGDINGDGVGDFVLSDGWLEAPSKNPKNKKPTTEWVMHKEFTLGKASVPIIVADVNKDKLADFIVGNAHGYGLDWYEQKKKGRKRSWIKHPIDPYQAQYHTMEWVDIDNDGEKELVTGKRYRAHSGHDAGDNDPPGLYYFKWNGDSFTKNVISFGPIGTGKGTGIYFSIADLRHSGRKDIIVAGKDGLWVFFNEGR